MQRAPPAIEATAPLARLLLAGAAAGVAGPGLRHHRPRCQACGLFIPLVVEGTLIGRLCGSMFGQPESSLFPVIGIAAFLAAGPDGGYVGIVASADILQLDEILKSGDRRS